MSLCFLLLKGDGSLHTGAFHQGTGLTVTQQVRKQLQAHPAAAHTHRLPDLGPDQDWSCFLADDTEEEDGSNYTPSRHKLSAGCLPAAAPPRSFAFQYLSGCVTAAPILSGQPADRCILHRVLRI